MMKTMHTVYLAAIFLVSVCQVGAERSYLLTAPKVLDAGSERLCLTLTDIEGPGTVNVRLLHENDTTLSETSITYPRHEPCFFLKIPNIKSTNAYIEVNGSFESDQYHFGSKTGIVIAPLAPVTVVQTDRAVYKPGQKVQFRILNVNHLLEPVANEITKVYIHNPNEVRVAQWLGIQNENGLVQLDMQLSDEPTLGLWKIYVEIQGHKREQGFEVSEYVLPKFEVTVTPPTTLFPDSDSATWKICAKYTYGKGVEGVLTAEIENTATKYWRIPMKRNLETKINECYNWTLRKEDSFWNGIDLDFGVINVSAKVKESGTDIEFSSSSSTKVERWPYTIEGRSNEDRYYFRPGLPYFGEFVVKKPDKEPAADVLILVCYEVNNTKECRNFTSDDKGIIKFTIPPQKPEVVAISVEATLALFESEHYNNQSYQEKLYQPQQQIPLAPWYSPSGSFLDVKPVLDILSCDTEVPLNIMYTTNGEDIILNYQVLSRGRIIDYGKKSYKFNIDDYNEDHSVIRNETEDSGKVKRSIDPSINVNYSLPQHIGKFSLPIQIKAEMAPITRVFVYYIRPDGEVVASYTTLKVMPCFVNKASFTFEKKSIKPGVSAKYKIRASPKSLCAIGVVDKSSNLLKTGHQITAERLFEIMKAFDVNVYNLPVVANNQAYCQEKYKDSNSTRPPPIRPRIIRTIIPAPRPIPIPPRLVPRPVPPSQTVFRPQYSYFWLNRYDQSKLKLVDASMAFETSGLTFLTSNDVNTRPCSPEDIYDGRYTFPPPPIRRPQPVRRPRPSPRPIPVAPARPLPRPLPAPQVRPIPRPPPVPKVQPIPRPPLRRPASPDDGVNEAVEVRNYFPETWLWDLEVVGDDGITNKEAEIPHTITEWTGSMFCTSKTDGLGISPSAAIKSFQPFFVSYTLPYSVIRNEKVPVIVTVFNYLPECLPIELRLEESEDFELLSNNTHRMCVCSGPATHRFRIQPTDLGKINLTVHSDSFVDATHEVCPEDGGASTLVARDAITKPLLVEAEGFPQESIQSVLFCPSEHQNGFKKAFELMLPDDLVQGSARAFLHVTGDIMGPSLSGLERLVRFPTGCGEQNMVLFAPNIFVIQYLQGIDSLTPEVENKALGFMRAGYQRELNYRHGDGSYSAFGESDPEGSSWLTAFVVKSFAQARHLIDIDPVDLKKSADWLLSKQQDDGCFPFIGMVHHQAMRGGVGRNEPTALTAYTVIAILESETPISQDKLDKAFGCISRRTSPDSYALALSVYAYTLAGRYEIANKLLDQLYSHATTEGADVYWAADSKSISVEIGSYVILSLMKLGGTANQAKAMQIVKWITRQRNANGGFVSTQDTVIALQAFAKFAVHLNRNKQDLEVAVEGNGLNGKYAINSTNHLLMQTNKIEELPNIIDVEAVGEGCGLIQTTLKFNKNIANASEVFDLTVKGRFHRRDCDKDKHTIDICAKYKITNEKSNMAVISLKMISGYIPVKRVLNNLKFDEELNLKRYEISNNFVNFYFDHLNNDQICFSIDVEKEIEVEETKPATVSVYDYYNSELKLDKSYELPSTC
uniref:TEP1-F n=1 Tax=Ammothea sp. RS-2014 TaxID=1569307 RepID=A0A0E4B7Z7_9CHEL|nr:alpha-2-macroglobulin 3 [Ammothea sp. RS-2014]